MKFCRYSTHFLEKKGCPDFGLTLSPDFKKRLFMRIRTTSFLIAIACFHVFAEGNAQKVTISEQHVSVRKLLDEIKKQTGYIFWYDNSILDVNKKVDILVKEGSVPQILDQVFSNLPLTYTIIEKTIVIRKKEDNPPKSKTSYVIPADPMTLPETKNSISGLTIEELETRVSNYKPAAIDISGKVTDEKGEGLSGVSIVLKGTQKGTSTDAGGNYTISLQQGSAEALNPVLLFSFVGYMAEEVRLAGRTVVNVSLKVDTKSLDELVVVGYGTQKKSDVTGSVASVKPKDLTQLPTRRVDQALQGRVAGLMVQNDNASPNAPVTLRIRGINSVNGGNDPLVVIDGMQLGNLSTLNPNEVESIEVLKDASATAIYGARGANGVVIVTTKKGKKGSPVVVYNTNISFNQVRKKLDQLNAEQYALTVNENRKEFGALPIFSESDINGFKTKSTNWQDVIFRRAVTQDHQLMVSGANDVTSYSLSATANKQIGVVRGSAFSGYSIRSNIKTKISDAITAGLNLFTNRTESNPTVINTYGGTNAASPVYSALQFAPVKPVYDADGNYTRPGGGYGPPTSYNPLALALEPIVENINTDINVLGDVEYKINSHFKINVLGGYKNTAGENSSYFNSKPSGSPGTEYAGIGNFKTLFLQNTNMLTYDGNFGRNGLHSLKVTGVVEQQYVKSNGVTAGSIGFLTDAVTYYNLSLGNNPQIPSSYGNTSTLMSYMARVNYGYSNLYSLTLTSRYDGSSVFGASNKWGSFPSVGVAWNIINEKFMQRVLPVSNLKLRASYGVVGNQAISPYQSLASLNNNLLYVLNGTSGSVGVGLGKIENPDLKWEKTKQFNLGVDLAFFGGRLNVVADYYDKKTTDLLFSVKLPATGGGSGSILRNVGSMQNKGFELYLGGQPLARDLKWETGITFSANRNKVLDLYEGLKELPLGDPGVPGFSNTLWLEVGQPVGLFRGFQSSGVWKTSEAKEAEVYGAQPGYPRYVDQNKDNKINASDIVNIGNSQPKFVFGWTNTLSFKKIDLSFFFQGVQGNKIYNVSRLRFEKTTTDADATSTRILDRWTPAHENTNIPSFKGSVVYEQNQSDRWLEDGSYIRLKNIALGYTFSSLHISRFKISSARLSVGGTNLITKTKYSGFEPEARTGVDSRGGVDIATYPSQKSVFVSLNVKF
jgi:TonB-linked SusC/RagA family outer membrane protein